MALYIFYYHPYPQVDTLVDLDSIPLFTVLEVDPEVFVSVDPESANMLECSYSAELKKPGMLVLKKEMDEGMAEACLMMGRSL